MPVLNRNPDLAWKFIDSDGTITLGAKIFGVSTMLILVSGTFASASLQLVYKDVAGTFVDFVGISAITTAGEVSVEIGKGMTIGVTTTASTGSTVISLGYVADDFRNA